MAESPAVIVRWDDFNGGDYGSLGPEKAPKNSFSANNMIVYADGSVGPRPGLRNITPASMPDGPLLGLAATPTPGRDGLFIIAEHVYRFDLNTPATAPTAIGDFDEAPDQPVSIKLDTATSLVAVNYAPNSTSDGVYRVDQVNDTITKLTGSSGGHDVMLLDQQVIVARSEFSPRILGSSPTDPNDWTEGRFADVGDNWQVTALYRVRDSVVIVKRQGIHILHGVLGDSQTESFSQVSTADAVLHPWQIARDQDDKLWFWTLFRRAPSWFDGSTLRYLGQYSLPLQEEDNTLADTPLKRGVVALKGDLTNSTMVFVQAGVQQRALVNHNGKWTFHEFETPVSGMCVANGEQFVTTDGGTNDDPAQIYSAVFNVSRPAFVSDNLAAPGDNSDTPFDADFSPAHWWSPDGREKKASQVIVDFTSYNTGTSETNHFDVELRVLGRDRAVEAVRSTDSDTAPDPFDEAVSASSVDGTRRRKTFMFDCPPGAGLELKLTNIRGCKFHSFTVLEAERKVRPI